MRSTSLPSKDPVVKEFIERISTIRNQIEKIILFGSRARGDERPSSDYDILLVVPERDPALVGAIHEAVMDVLFSTGRLVSPKIFRRTDFERFSRIPTPFMKNVMQEGISLG